MNTPHYQSISQWRNTLPGDWSSWKWQMQNAIRDSGSLNEILSTFTVHRCSAVPRPKETGYFSLKITPHMVLALKNALEESVSGAWKAFSSGFVPNENEFANLSFEREGIDCIGEELSVFNPVPSITNFYRSRVLFRVTNMCPAYCRYCFRRRMVGDGLGAWNESSINEGINYIANNNEIREVILSGGDPLVLSDDKLGFILESLSKIPHIRRLRIDSKALTMIPQRITEEFVQLLSKHQPIYFIAHFAHHLRIDSGD